MSFAVKRIKLSTLSPSSDPKIKNENDSGSANLVDVDSAYQSQVDFTNSVDFSLPKPRRKHLIRQSNVNNKNQRSIEFSEHAFLGYSSLSSPSSVSPKKISKSSSPKKRKLESTESDENAFQNSYQFVSPLKIRKRDASNSNYAKLVLKEKSSSENVIRCSTPILESKNKLWGRFRSLHPEKIGSSLEEVESPSLARSTSASFDIGCSSDFTSSFNLTNTEHHDEANNVPNNVQQLWASTILNPITESEPTETITQSQEAIVTETTNPSQEEIIVPAKVKSFSSSRRTRYHCGRLKMDILGTLHMEENLALKKILSHFNDVDLLSLSHVSKDYRTMIKSNKTLEAKRQDYLTAHQIIKENKVPGSRATSLPKPSAAKSRKRTLGDSNVNHSMQLRPKPVSPPVSPSRKRFYENQKVIIGFGLFANAFTYMLNLFFFRLRKHTQAR